MDVDLTGRRALVTGASRGIGRATALALAQAGADVALIARSADDLDKVAETINEIGSGRAFPVVADLRDPSAIEQGVARSLRAMRGLDVLVNNAGDSPAGSFDDLTDRQWESSLELKLLGYVRCIRAVLPTMRDTGYGRIVNVVGAGGRQASPSYVLGGINAALLHLTKSLAEWLAHEGVTVTAINPSATATQRIESMIEARARSSGRNLHEFRSTFVEDRLPLGRMATPGEIAALITFLASDDAELLTGSALNADGATTAGIF